MNQAIRQVAEDSFRDWKNKFPSPIAIKLQSIQNEVFLVIDTLLWFNRLKSGCNLDESSKWQQILHFMLSTLAPYIQNRLLSSSSHYIRWMYKMAAICRLANFLQLLHFYHNGGYQNLTERITRLKVIPRETLDLLNFEAFNRKLIWCSFRDLLVLLIPLRNYFWGTTRYKGYEEHADVKTVICTRCQQRVVIPVKNVTCGHICCYTCFYTEPFCASACDECRKNLIGEGRVKGTLS
ncbi:Peroxisome biogenesis protein [Dirofilaria immitis]